MLKKINISKKALEWGLIFGFICSVFCSFADFAASCEELRDNVLRLHIVANSDSEQDQTLKLEIRDRILEESQSLFEPEKDLQSAIKTAKENLKLYEKIANEVISEAGLDYKAEAKIGKAFFETRVYEDFTLPSGEYESLIINLGKAEGKNWWCVVFPSVCLPLENRASLSQSVGEKGCEIAQNGEKFKVKFKTVEIYEKIKKSLKNAN